MNASTTAAEKSASFTDTTDFLDANKNLQSAADNIDTNRCMGRYVEVEGQQLSVRVVKAAVEKPEEAPTIMMLTPWSDDPNFDNAAGVALAASGEENESHRSFNVVLLGVPGVGKGASGLTRKQVWDLWCGSFDSVSEAQIVAFEKAYRWAFGQDFDKERELHLWGASQGASNAVSMAKIASREHGYKIGDVIMGANVALVQRNSLKLFLGYGADGKANMGLIKKEVLYKNDNDPTLIHKKVSIGAMALQLLRAPLSHLMPVLAMATGVDGFRIKELVKKGVIKNLVHWGGETDPISTPADREALHNEVESRLRTLGGASISRTMEHEPHGIVSLQGAAAYISARYHRARQTVT